LLNWADVLLTLNLLKRGAQELNAFMAMLINTDVQLFIALQMALTGAALIFLVIHHRFQVFRRLRVDHVLHAVLLIYLLLAGYELMLLQPMRILAPTVSIILLGVMLAIMGLYLERKHTPRRDD
jgi:hypothetical protein